MAKRTKQQDINTAIVRYFRNNGYGQLTSFDQWIKTWCLIKGIDLPVFNGFGKCLRKQQRAFINEIYRQIGGMQPAKTIQNNQSKLKKFYASWEWKRLAYECKMRDGRKCMCCNSSAEQHGVRIVSDHIKPVRTHWHLRLEPTNIQTLCDDCNRGKGSHDDTDFR